MEKEYRNWLTQHCDLYDWTTQKYRTENHVLEYFRRNPKKYKRQFDNGRFYIIQYQPTLKALSLHRQRNPTILISNTFTRRSLPHSLLMLVDIDAKHGQQDAPELAQFVSSEFFEGRTYIEPSRGGKGRHVYFLLDREFRYPSEVKPVIVSLAKRIKEVCTGMFEATVDDVFGVPTIWRDDVIEYRGNVLKLPYLPGGQDDVECLRHLKPVLISDLNKEESQSVPTPKPLVCAPLPSSNTLGRTNTPPPNTGWQKKIRLVSQHLIRTNGITPDLNALYAEYMASCQPTIESGDTQKRMAVLEKVVTHLLATFNPSSGTFDRDKYLSLVTDLVPPLAFRWKRREKIDHRRLADFIAVKISDADFGFQFGRVARDTTLKRFKALKEQGIVDWVPGNNQYAKLLTLATGCGLLEVFEQWERPSHEVEGMKIVRRKGRARCIGPGVALPDERARFVITYEKIRPTQEVKEIA